MGIESNQASKETPSGVPKTDSPHWIILFAALFALVGVLGALFGPRNEPPLGPARLLADPPETPSMAWKSLATVRENRAQGNEDERPLVDFPLTELDFRDVIYNGYTTLAERLRLVQARGGMRVLVDLDRHLVQVMREDFVLKSYLCTLDKPSSIILHNLAVRFPVFLVTKRMSEPMDVLVLRAAQTVGANEPPVLSAFHGQAGLRLENGTLFVKDWTENSIALLDWDYRDLADSLPVGTPVMFLASKRNP